MGGGVVHLQMRGKGKLSYKSIDPLPSAKVL